LHTNDAVAAITRLKDLGVAPFVIASSLLAVMGQRLVRTLCPKCKRKAPFTENMRDRWRSALGSEIPLPTHYYRAVGCKACNQIGYSGRLGVFELAVVNEKVRDLISSDVQESEMRRLLKKLGMKAMIENGIEKITEGITTPEEILRVVSIEDNAANEGVSA
jgi:general secretion pathway protein E